MVISITLSACTLKRGGGGGGGRGSVAKHGGSGHGGGGERRPSEESAGSLKGGATLGTGTRTRCNRRPFFLKWGGCALVHTLNCFKFKKNKKTVARALFECVIHEPPSQRYGGG